MKATDTPPLGTARGYRLSLTLLLVVVATLALDVSARFLPLEWFTFRAWEAYKLNRAPAAAFLPNKRYENEAVYGDLAALGNLPSLRQHRPEVFTTDQYGYRNAIRDWASSPPSILLMGSSFSAAPGMSDHETLSAQLEALDGRGVYNAAGYFDEMSVSRVRSVANATSMRGGTVVLEYVERFDLPPSTYAPPGCGPGYLEPCGPAMWTLTRLLSLWQISPFQILVERGLKQLQNDSLLPNAYANRVVQSRLVNGEIMLFLPEEVSRFERLRRDDRAAVERGSDYFARFAEELRREDFDLVVLLVPNKYTVYRALIAGASVDEDSDGYLEHLARRTQERGVSVVNLSPIFRTQAAERLTRGEYIYWRDDTHWNPQGIHLAAQELRQTWAHGQQP